MFSRSRKKRQRARKGDIDIEEGYVIVHVQDSEPDKPDPEFVLVDAHIAKDKSALQ
jgi:hypothetical protein